MPCKCQNMFVNGKKFSLNIPEHNWAGKADFTVNSLFEMLRNCDISLNKLLISDTLRQQNLSDLSLGIIVPIPQYLIFDPPVCKVFIKPNEEGAYCVCVLSCINQPDFAPLCAIA